MSVRNPIARVSLTVLSALLIGSLFFGQIILFSSRASYGTTWAGPDTFSSGIGCSEDYTAAAPQSVPDTFNIADELQNLPATTREELLAITDKCTLEFHLEKLQDLKRFYSGYNETDFYSSPSVYSKVLMYPSETIAAYFYLSPIFVSSNSDQEYALLMLKFTDMTRSDELITTSAIDYNVEIFPVFGLQNDTNAGSYFNWSGTTTTGLDIIILNTTQLEGVFNYNDKVITITKINDN